MSAFNLTVLYSMDDKPMKTSVFFFLVICIVDLKTRVLFGIKYIDVFGMPLLPSNLDSATN